MNTKGLIDTARALVAGDTGLLATYESNPACDQRFAGSAIPRPGQDADAAAAAQALLRRARCGRAEYATALGGR